MSPVDVGYSPPGMGALFGRIIAEQLADAIAFLQKPRAWGEGMTPMHEVEWPVARHRCRWCGWQIVDESQGPETCPDRPVGGLAAEPIRVSGSFTIATPEGWTDLAGVSGWVVDSLSPSPPEPIDRSDEVRSLWVPPPDPERPDRIAAAVERALKVLRLERQLADAIADGEEAMRQRDEAVSRLDLVREQRVEAQRRCTEAEDALRAANRDLSVTVDELHRERRMRRAAEQTAARKHYELRRHGLAVGPLVIRAG